MEEWSKTNLSAVDILALHTQNICFLRISNSISKELSLSYWHWHEVMSSGHLSVIIHWIHNTSPSSPSFEIFHFPTCLLSVFSKKPHHRRLLSSWKQFKNLKQDNGVLAQILCGALLILFKFLKTDCRPLNIIRTMLEVRHTEWRVEGNTLCCDTLSSCLSQKIFTFSITHLEVTWMTSSAQTRLLRCCCWRRCWWCSLSCPCWPQPLGPQGHESHYWHRQN